MVSMTAGRVGSSKSGPKKLVGLVHWRVSPGVCRWQPLIQLVRQGRCGERPALKFRLKYDVLTSCIFMVYTVSIVLLLQGHCSCPVRW